ncbi:MAG TPA: hypothetical protein VD813_01950 [Pseudonocardia sp.]|nr:hypothetical protein [Pseudonocardia sp.]
MFGAVIAQGRDYRETFQVFAPGFDLTEQREARAAAGDPERFGEEDLYPDARSTLAELRGAGLWVGIAGNQTLRAGRILKSLDLPADMIATSDDWGVAKPDPAFSIGSRTRRRATPVRSSTWATGWTTTSVRLPPGVC